MEFPKDIKGEIIPCFAPRLGVELGTTVVVDKPTLYKIGTSVDITINGKTVPYEAGTEITFVPGVTYTLSASTVAHEM